MNKPKTQRDLTSVDRAREVYEGQRNALRRLMVECHVYLTGDAVTESALEQAEVMLGALRIFAERNARYKDGWATAGWRGVLFDLRKKTERLWRQFWHGQLTIASVDDAYDLINFAAFFIRAQASGLSEWGTWGNDHIRHGNNRTTEGDGCSAQSATVDRRASGGEAG